MATSSRLAGLKSVPPCVGDWQESGLGHVIGNAEQFGGFGFLAKVQRGQAATKSAATEGELEAPHRRHDRAHQTCRAVGTVVGQTADD